MTDPIADMLIRIKNAYNASHQAVLVPFSKLKIEVLKILKKEGYVSDYQKKEYDQRPFVKVRLRYINGQPAISDLRKVSKPGRRIYVGKVSPLKRFGGITIISTSKGLKTLEEAKVDKIGGELLCEIW